MLPPKPAGYVVLQYPKPQGGDYVSPNPMVGLFLWGSLVRLCKLLGLVPHAKGCKASTLEELLKESESKIDSLRHHGITRLEAPEQVLYDIESLVDRLLGKLLIL